MIKKLLSIAFFALTAHVASAQCTPNPAYVDSPFGVWPDTTENLPLACVNNPNGYSAVIDLKTLTDTTVAITLAGQNISVVAFIEAFRINEVQGLPAGFSYIANSTIWTNGGSSPNFTPVQGCVNILAAQSAIQTISDANPTGIDIPLNVIVDAKISETDNAIANGLLGINNIWLSDLSTIPGIGAIEVGGYKIRIRPASDPDCLNAGTAELIAPVSAKGNFPNPFVKNTSIQFNSDAAKAVNLSVSNMVGKVVYTSKLQASKGENNVNFTADQLTPGVYFYTISDGKNSVTRRMVVAAN